MGRCPRFTGVEGSYPPVHFRAMQRREDRFDHGIRLCLDVPVPEPQNTVARRSQEAITPVIVRGTLQMLTSIEFDGELSIERGEVADIEADLVLTSELEAADLSTP